MMVLLSILTLTNVISWEKYTIFVTIDFHVVKVKPLKKKFQKCSIYFITKSFLAL